LFLKQAASVWSEAEKAEFIDHMALNPTVGDIIPDTGGVRKVRWRRAGSGKRGGVRVIYYYFDPFAPLYLLMVYAKVETENLSSDDKRAVTDLTSTLKRYWRQQRN